MHGQDRSCSGKGQQSPLLFKLCCGCQSFAPQLDPVPFQQLGVAGCAELEAGSSDGGESAAFLASSLPAPFAS